MGGAKILLPKTPSFLSARKGKDFSSLTLREKQGLIEDVRKVLEFFDDTKTWKNYHKKDTEEVYYKDTKDRIQ
jgi:hypothetical protein